MTLSESLLAFGIRIEFRTGDIVFRQGSQTRFVGFVESGAVRLVRHGPAGETVVLHEAGAGEWFAEASLNVSRLCSSDAI